MSDIIKQKQIHYKERQSLKRVGKAIYDTGLETSMKHLCRERNIEHEDCINSCDKEILGSQFLKTINQCGNSMYELSSACTWFFNFSTQICIKYFIIDILMYLLYIKQ